MLRIRLRRMGKKKQPMYRIVVADSQSPRDGAFVESIGYYHPLENPSRIVLDADRTRHWLDHGAQPSERVAKILAIEGIQEVPAKLKTRIAVGEERKKQAEADKAKARAEAAEEAKAEAPTAEAPAEEPTAEAPAEEPTAEAPPAEAEAPADEPAAEPAAAEEPAGEAPTEETASDEAAETKTPQEETAEASDEEKAE